MRAGFVAYGAGVAVAAMADRRRRPLVRAALFDFGLGLLAAAIWSNAPIIEGVPSDLREDWLHSVASGVVGTSFAVACATRLFAPGGNRRDLLAWTGLVISVAVPALMPALPEVRGVLQRAMFVYSFIFIEKEFAWRD